MRRPGHRDRLLDDQVGDLRGNRHHHRARQRRHEPGDRGEPVGAGRQVEQQEIERAPGRVGEELAEGVRFHVAAPDVGLRLAGGVPGHGRLVRRQEQIHGHHLDPLGAHGRLHPGLGELEPHAAHPEHLGDGGTVEIGVEDADGGALAGKRRGEVGRQRRLPDPALARDDRHDAADGRQPGLEPALLLLHLLDDVGAAVTDDVLVLFHPAARRSSPHASPRSASTPSLKINGSMASAATGSAHHQPARAFSPRPRRSVSDR